MSFPWDASATLNHFTAAVQCSCSSTEFMVSPGQCPTCTATVVTMCSYCLKTRCASCLVATKPAPIATSSQITAEQEKALAEMLDNDPNKRKCNICTVTITKNSPGRHWKTQKHFDCLVSSKTPEKYCKYGCHMLLGGYKKLVTRREHLESYSKISDDDKERVLTDDQSACHSCGGLKLSEKEYAELNVLNKS